jgi:hypothetical protein
MVDAGACGPDADDILEEAKARHVLGWESPSYEYRPMRRTP